jgi:hypothetical protein
MPPGAHQPSPCTALHGTMHAQPPAEGASKLARWGSAGAERRAASGE